MRGRARALAAYACLVVLLAWLLHLSPSAVGVGVLYALAGILGGVLHLR